MRSYYARTQSQLTRGANSVHNYCTSSEADPEVAAWYVSLIGDRVSTFNDAITTHRLMQGAWMAASQELGEALEDAYEVAQQVLQVIRYGRGRDAAARFRSTWGGTPLSHSRGSVTRFVPLLRDLVLRTAGRKNPDVSEERAAQLKAALETVEAAVLAEASARQAQLQASAELKTCTQDLRTRYGAFLVLVNTVGGSALVSAVFPAFPKGEKEEDSAESSASAEDGEMTEDSASSGGGEGATGGEGDYDEAPGGEAGAVM